MKVVAHTLNKKGFIENPTKKVSGRSETQKIPETDWEIFFGFPKTKKGFPSNSETLKEFPIVAKSETQKGFREKNPFPRPGNPFWFPISLLSETL
jgi:hypothetical protein